MKLFNNAETTKMQCIAKKLTKIKLKNTNSALSLKFKKKMKSKISPLLRLTSDMTASQPFHLKSTASTHFSRVT